MLKGIPGSISPDLMHALMNMGHGDEIVLADAHFPASSHSQRLIRADGLRLSTLLSSIMKFFPIDTFVEDHAVVMQVVDPKLDEPSIWDQFLQILSKSEGDWVSLTPIERFSFYNRSKSAYAVVATGETDFYANLILKKGVVSPDKQEI